MRTVVSAMSDKSPVDARENTESQVVTQEQLLQGCVGTLEHYCRLLRSNLAIVCKKLRQLEGLAQNNVPGAQDELERMLKLFERECGYVERNPDPVAAGNGAAAGAPAGSAAGGAAASAAGGAAASAAGAKMDEQNPYTILREARRQRERESLSSSLAAASAAAGGAADVSDAQRAKMDARNKKARERRAAKKRRQALEDRLFVAGARGWVPDGVAAAGGDAAGSASAQSNGAAAAGGDALESDDDLYN